ncbi:TspO/MBR family protein [Micrococcus luteus]
MPTPSEREQTAKRARGFTRALGLNLVLNTGWSALFWQGRNLPVSAVEAGPLAISSADLARRAGQLDRGAGALLAPYTGWTAFAAVLTTRIEQVN